MLLFTGRNSICTQKVLITMFEKNLSWQTKRVDLFQNEQYDAEYLKYNPKGVVPTLVNDGQVIIESTLICEYLDDTFPVPSLVPESAFERSQMRLWSKHVDEGLFEATREISFSAMFRERLRNMSEEQRQIRFRNIGDPARTARFMSTYEDGVESPYVFYGIAAFEKLFQHMSEALTERREWLVGNTLSLGDINLMPFVARLEYLNLLDLFIADREPVRRWWQHCKTLSSYRKAVPDMLNEEDTSAMHASGTKIRARIGELRAEYLAQHRKAKHPA
jgi:glutathione S-transferase